ncbi:MAG: hypothetical protein GY754_26595 [bacterium]|nr:hypothetical protein [bacterium]
MKSMKLFLTVLLITGVFFPLYSQQIPKPTIYDDKWENKLDTKDSSFKFRGGGYHEIRIAFDLGIEYGVFVDEGQTYSIINDQGIAEPNTVTDYKKVYSAETNGMGAGLQYAYLFEIGKFTRWQSKPMFGMGPLGLASYIYSKENSLITIGAGAELKLVWVVNCYAALGYAYFTKDFPIVTYGSNNGFFGLLGVGIEIPISEQYDLFANFDNTYHKNELTTVIRRSFKFGVILKL